MVTIGTSAPISRRSRGLAVHKGAVSRSIPASISGSGDQLSTTVLFLCARRLG
jgi:hypothetical protein